MGNPVIHFEIKAQNGEELGKFYSGLFGWHAQKFGDQNYVLIDTHAGKGINGAIGDTDAPNATFYIEVPDLKPALDEIESLGGKIRIPPTEVPNVVTFATFADPEGNVIGLVQGDEDQQPEGAKENNPPVDWFEVIGKDAKALQDFYSKAFGWKIKSGDAPGIVYGEVDTGAGRGIPGGIGSSPTGEARVTVYSGVDDLRKYLDKAEQLGGKTVMEPAEVGGGTSIALFVDPEGNTFGLYKGM